MTDLTGGKKKRDFSKCGTFQVIITIICCCFYYAFPRACAFTHLKMSDDLVRNPLEWTEINYYQMDSMTAAAGHSLPNHLTLSC